MSERIYSKKEVEQLIKKAVELESKRPLPEKKNWENGLNIGELKNVAAETGLDPELIERAAYEMDVLPEDHEEKVRVNRDEITSEVWLDSKPDKETLDMLVTELNHIYGTTDELNWWEKLWQIHKGKAKIERKPNFTEWIYTSSSGAFFTRVLLQQRGERFRIRVSKRQIYNLDWDSALNTLLIIVLPLAFFLGIFGGAVSEKLWGMFWPGLGAGIMLSLLSYPLLRYIDKRHINKYKSEVDSTIRQLSELVMQSSNKSESKSSITNRNTSTSEIEIPEEKDTSQDESRKLRNHLRE
ncbi:hypothetical protein [Gracilimonas sp.]|uniref:hypothetical protein n=1 Tax=Gracilimonas sp. TaxID=1974203 RepID=UPI002871451A|nr:hypothetical protein [Gracilimonas sp.]